MQIGKARLLLSSRLLDAHYNYNYSTNRLNSPILARDRIKSPLRLAFEQRFLSSGRSAPFRLGRNVREAIANGSPMVALESTVITHGLPEPENLNLAMNLELEIHKLGVIPATVAIIKGQLVVGLSRDEIEYLANKRESCPIKASRRDIPIAMARGVSAGTTVAGTMAIVASLPQHLGLKSTLSPIKVFATGGTGGVHIGGQESMDVSADLYEMARSPMCVVSSGFKSFLDTRRSLEILETFGCTVMSLSSKSTQKHCLSGAGNDDDSCLFPGFFTKTNWQRVKSPCIVRDTREAAEIVFHSLEAPLANRRASLLAVPIPEEFALDEQGDENLRQAMESVIQIDKRTDLEGKEKTPLILEALNCATGGKTLGANIELLRNNSKTGAQLALDYASVANKSGKWFDLS